MGGFFVSVEMIRCVWGLFLFIFFPGLFVVSLFFVLFLADFSSFIANCYWRWLDMVCLVDVFFLLSVLCSFLDALDVLWLYKRL